MNAYIVNVLLKSNPLLSVVGIATLFAAIVTASLPLVVLSGIIAFGRPLLYAYLLNLKEAGSSEASVTPVTSARTFRPGIASAA
jgi:hypothetical protein